MTEKQHSGNRRSRREFLKASAAAVAGSQLVSSTEVKAQTPPTLPPRATPGFDHLVVVMFENRSLDNLLGYLYEPGELPAGETFDGLAGKSYSNPSPSGPIAAHVYTGPTDSIMDSPSPDPGEEYPHVNTQIFGTVDPPTNAHLNYKKMKAPYNAPQAGTPEAMQGFVKDYINNYFATQSHAPTEKEYAVAMGSFSREMLPVTSTLARNFAVYDRWFCAVPSQTFCNRSFFHASTSSGFVTNDGKDGYRKWLDRKLNPATTIFNRLEEKGIPWAVYFDASQIVSLTGFINAPALEPYWKTHFRSMTQFYDDARTGKLPAYSFIEPRLLFDHNDMHPPVATFTFTNAEGKKDKVGGNSDVRAGEKLLHDIYSAVRTSATPNGSNAMNTLLLVTFDEHGGIHDHVPPPSAVPPAGLKDTEMDFTFDRLGVRVPAIAISAYTRAGTIIHDEMHHAAVIATLCEKFGLEPLTARDTGARSLKNAVNLTEPRQSWDWPETTPQYVPPNPEATGPFTPQAGKAPLTPPGLALMGMLVEKFHLPKDQEPKTYDQAWKLLQRVGKGLFGGV
ncbi:MAG: alkaline phosphatase family protein [Hyphomicrobiales bacterium]